MGKSILGNHVSMQHVPFRRCSACLPPPRSRPLARRPAGMGYLVLYEGILPTYAAFGFGILFISLLAQAALSPSSLLATNACLATQCASIGTLRPAILVTIGWCALYFCFLQCQSAAAFWIHKVKREEGGKKDDLAARRSSTAGARTQAA